jgi:hypothetical protein
MPLIAGFPDLHKAPLTVLLTGEAPMCSGKDKKTRQTMKTLTLLQAGALLMLAVIGAYASPQHHAQTACAKPGTATEVCDL